MMDLLDLRSKIYKKLNKPTIFFWFSKNNSLYFSKKVNKLKFAYEIFKQIIWSSKRCFFYIVNIKLFEKIPFETVIKAYILNCFSLHELLIWQKYGVIDWADLSEKIPNLYSCNYHNFKRKNWPENCEKAINLLSNKGQFYSVCPMKKVLPKYLITKNKVYESKKWIFNYLKNDGIVIKPIKGYRMNNIYRYRYLKKKNLLLINDINSTKIKKLKLKNCELDLILKHWTATTRSRDESLIMPYLKNYDSDPNLFGSIVIRTITQKLKNDSKAIVKYSWFEIPVADNFYLFFDKKGRILNSLIQPKKHKNKDFLKYWEKEIKKNYLFIKDLNYIEKYSLLIHNFISNIDSVAWDWILTKKSPKLLEGNSHYGLFIPQIIDQQRKLLLNKNSKKVF